MQSAVGNSGNGSSRTRLFGRQRPSHAALGGDKGTSLPSFSVSRNMQSAVGNSGNGPSSVSRNMQSAVGNSGNGPSRRRLFGRQRTLHAALGGGKVADVLLWRDIKISSSLLVGIGVIWFLFEVIEFTLLTLACYILITTMLVIFVWSTGAKIFKWKAPEIPDVLLDETTFKEVAAILHSKVNSALSKLLYIAGNDIKLFFLTTILLLVLSMIGNAIRTLNLLFVGLFCLETLPILYERYEDEIDNVGRKLIQRAETLYKKFDSVVLKRIPRGPVKND